MAIKKNLLEIVQQILSDMDAEPVNSLSDTVESEQVAAIVEQTFNDLIVTRFIPEHQQLIKLTPLSNNLYPTHFIYPTNVNDIRKVWYDISEDTNDRETRQYREVSWCDPLDFITLSDRKYNMSEVQVVDDQQAGTQLYVHTDRMPTYYTSFDDRHIIMDSFDSAFDDTLQASKVRAYGTMFPVFDRFSDTYVPDIDEQYFSYLIQESKSRAFEVLKGGTLPKVDQASRRARYHLINDRYKTKRRNNWNDFGRPYHR